MIIPDEDKVNTGYAEYIPIEDASRVIQVPNSVPLEVAAMLPGNALNAYAAVNSAKPHVDKLRKVKCKRMSLLKLQIIFISQAGITRSISTI